MARAVVAGAGYVGMALAERLAARGDEVWILRRSAQSAPAGVWGLRADLTDPASLRDWPRAAELVFYTAAADGPDPDAYRRAYVDGLRNAITAWRTHGGVGRFFFTSSTSVYGQSDGEWVDESSPTEPSGHRGAITLEAEALVAELGAAGTCVRLGGLYGPGREGLIARVRRGEARRRAGAPHYTNRIHRDDAVGLLVHLARREEVHRLYLGVDCEPATESDVLCFVAERLGVAHPAPLGPDESPARRAGSKRASNRRARESGYRFAFATYREGYASLIERGERGALR